MYIHIHRSLANEGSGSVEGIACNGGLGKRYLRKEARLESHPVLMWCHELFCAFLWRDKGSKIIR